MTLKRYASLILQRFPREQFAQNCFMILDLFNTLQRHQVNRSTGLTLKEVFSRLGEIGEISDHDVEAFIQHLREGHTPAEISRRRTTPSQVQSLARSMALTCGEVLGSPAAFRRLQSEATAAWHGLGCWTLALTLNPSDLNSCMVYELAGHGYSFNVETALPDHTRPEGAARWRIIARNPVACAQFFHVFMRAFIEDLGG
eukprot:37875-Eustigmatos_ZCMA.PRE.1